MAAQIVWTKPMRTKVIYSLCDYSGNWAKPYQEANYKVRLIDLKNGQDVRLLLRPVVPMWEIVSNTSLFHQ